MHDDAASGEFQAQFVQRQFTILVQAPAHPVTMRIQLAATHMTLPPWRERSGLPLQDHQGVHKTRRHAEVSRRLPMAVTFLDKRNNSTTQCDRM